jgi:hypothetical protein
LTILLGGVRGGERRGEEGRGEERRGGERRGVRAPILGLTISSEASSMKRSKSEAGALATFSLCLARHLGAIASTAM